MKSHKPPQDHTAIDDAQGLSLGVFLCSFGVYLLTSAGLITGQTAGVAVIIAYLSGYSFGAVFFVINLPFYAIAWQRLGTAFTVKSLISVTMLSVITEVIPLGITIQTIHPLFAAIAFGALVGLGLLAMFRHNGSLGGFGVVALLVQDSTGFRAGWVQLIFDVIVFGAALFLFELPIVLYSIVGAIVLNLIIAINHRRDRYIAV
ncbi:YitT family protein [Sulfitobacter sp.]|uniref:YitT family protein n=1 Tax=Sulfitobacter sp. TaxID=1903071 RepID=UPI00329A6F17